MPTPQIFTGMARSLENGKVSGQSDGWAGSSAVKTLGAGQGLPYLSFDTEPELAFKEDASIVNSVFGAGTRLVGKSLSKPFSILDRFYGQNDINYWMMGFEADPVQVVCFSSTELDPWNSVPPTVGDIYTPDSGTTNFTYLRTEVVRNTNGVESNLYIFSNSNNDVLPTIPTPPATAQMLNGTNEFNWTGRSEDMYEHLYELDSLGRRIRAYTTAEQAVTGWATGDLKNLMMTLGKRFDTYDQRIQNAMCKSWSWKVSAGDLAMLDCNYVAYNQTRGDYDSDSWTLQSGGAKAFNVPAAHETLFKIGTIFSGGSSDMVSLGMKEIALNCDMPLDESQSIVSGVWLDVPILNAKYGLTMTGIIGRHSVTTYQDMMDALTPICAQIKCSQGYYMKEYLIKRATITSAGPDNSPVIAENFNFAIEFCEVADNPFALSGDSHLQGFTEYQNSPLILRVRDESSVNVMFAQ